MHRRRRDLDFEKEAATRDGLSHRSTWGSPQRFSARLHWQAVVDNYPNDPNMPGALYGIARSYYQERRYEEARQMFERVAGSYPETREGREGSNFAASSLLRMGRGDEAASRYIVYL